MAEIHIEKKKSILPWIIAAIVALLLIWGVVELMDNDEVDAVTPATSTAAIEGTDASTNRGAAAAGVAMVPVSTILAGPASYVGKTVSGTARVTDVPTDRGFWIEQDGQRMFALIQQGPNMEDAININTGQEIQLNNATVHDATSMAQLDGSLDDEARQILGTQQAFLVVDPANVTIVSR